jgi:hypothetical protein
MGERSIGSFRVNLVFDVESGNMMFCYGTISKARVKMIKWNKVERDGAVGTYSAFP